jgi:hypothetical protein
MVKYKLIEVYPGSLPLGTISTLDYSAYPKNWEAFVEKEYEIVDSIISVDSNPKILSVRRLSDGEVFVIGDEVTISERNSITYKLVNFTELTDCIQVHGKSNNKEFFYSLKSVIRLKQRTILYTTFDGVKRYHYQKEHWVLDNGYLYTLMVCNLHLSGTLSKCGGKFKIFSTKEKADEYIANTAPLFTTEDGIEVFKTNHPKLYWVKNNFLTGSDSENSLHNPDTINYKYFSKKENVEEFIKMNRPEFSRKQVLGFIEHLNIRKNNVIINYTIVENEKN